MINEMLRHNLKSKHLILFFTYGVSLELWKNKGLLERELKLYKELGKYFNKIYFITYGRDDNKFVDDLRLYNIEVLSKKTWLPNFVYSLFLPWFYKTELKNCDFFKTNQMLGSWSAVISKWLFKKKLIVRTGYTLSIFSKKVSRLKYLFAKIIERLALDNCDLLIVATEEEKKYFEKYNNKIKIVPNYVDTELFKPMLELRNKEEKTVLLFIGRLNKQKNLENLIVALENLDNTRLQIIGAGKLEQELKKLSEDKKVTVEFLGNIPHEELPKYINYADIFVLPSWYEGNPKVLLEAMACGLPILVTDVGGVNNIIKHQDTGYLVQTDTVSLRQGIQELVRVEEAQLGLGHKAREYILQNNSLGKILELELENYK